MVHLNVAFQVFQGLKFNSTLWAAQSSGALLPSFLWGDNNSWGLPICTSTHAASTKTIRQAIHIYLDQFLLILEVFETQGTFIEFVGLQLAIGR